MDNNTFMFYQLKETATLQSATAFAQVLYIFIVPATSTVARRAFFKDSPR